MSKRFNRRDLAKIFNMVANNKPIPRILIELYKDDKRYCNEVVKILKGSKLDSSFIEFEVLSRRSNIREEARNLLKEVIEVELVRDEINVLLNSIRKKAFILATLLIFIIPVISSLLPIFQITTNILSSFYIGSSKIPIVTMNKPSLNLKLSFVFFIHGLTSLLISLYYITDIASLKKWPFIVLAVIVYIILFNIISHLILSLI